MDGRPKAVILGAGNVAWSLAPALAKVADIEQIYSPTFSHAEELAKTIDSIGNNNNKSESAHGSLPCRAIDSIAEVARDADFYIISVKDDAIAEVASALKGVRGVVAHTSGSVPIEALGDSAEHYGVFYPLQTFSKARPVDMRHVPFFIEGNTDEAYSRLAALAGMISDRVYPADSAHRATLHIAAVFACNFANNLWAIAADLLEKDGYSLDVLKPLLEATLDKAMGMHPAMAQTGPAVRGDEKVLAKHISRLDGLDRDIYEILTQSIINHKRI